VIHSKADNIGGLVSGIKTIADATDIKAVASFKKSTVETINKHFKAY
jgi:hypothetical protein